MCCSENDELKDCHEPDVIDEYEFSFFDDDDITVDEYLAKGWQTSDEGYRRFDSDVHNECEYRVFPTRYRLKDFKLSKSLRRVLNKNRDLKMSIRPFRPTEAKDDLYTAHLHSRFEKEKPRYTLQTAYDHLKYSYVQPMEAVVFKENKLIACSVFEVSENSVFGSRAFWDPNLKNRSLGILTVLLEMQFGVKNGKEFYYLGHYFEQNPVYRYKSRFPAFDLWDWDNERWVDYKLEKERVVQMFDHKFKCRDDQERDPKFAVSLFEMASKYNERILASALIGSRARGDEHEDSDFDFLILTDDAQDFFKDDKFANSFHRWRESKVENSPLGKTLRAFYKNGDVFEFIFVSASWADLDSIDEVKKRIVKEGFKILYDPDGKLEKLQNEIMSKKFK
ncbi:MAG TPA: nucleotidyltransferase domain-containing protein [Pyrinomonadaceae bacterium]|nr:nucleotidyltransferase domain-containing protein [Pyrinomonadaceae bacterium]